MVHGIVKDAVHIKMTLPHESPLISVYEFCYAAGLGLKIMQVDEKKAGELKKTDDFMKFKEQIWEIVKPSVQFEAVQNGPRLKSLILGCRIRGEMPEDARIMFDMGYQSEF